MDSSSPDRAGGFGSKDQIRDETLHYQVGKHSIASMVTPGPSLRSLRTTQAYAPPLVPQQHAAQHSDLPDNQAIHAHQLDKKAADPQIQAIEALFGKFEAQDDARREQHLVPLNQASEVEHTAFSLSDYIMSHVTPLSGSLRATSEQNTITCGQGKVFSNAISGHPQFQGQRVRSPHVNFMEHEPDTKYAATAFVDKLKQASYFNQNKTACHPCNNGACPETYPALFQSKELAVSNPADGLVKDIQQRHYTFDQPDNMSRYSDFLTASPSNHDICREPGNFLSDPPAASAPNTYQLHAHSPTSENDLPLTGLPHSGSIPHSFLPGDTHVVIADRQDRAYYINNCFPPQFGQSQSISGPKQQGPARPLYFRSEQSWGPPTSQPFDATLKELSNTKTSAWQKTLEGITAGTVDDNHSNYHGFPTDFHKHQANPQVVECARMTNPIPAEVVDNSYGDNFTGYLPSFREAYSSHGTGFQPPNILRDSFNKNFKATLLDVIIALETFFNIAESYAGYHMNDIIKSIVCEQLMENLFATGNPPADTSELSTFDLEACVKQGLEQAKLWPPLDLAGRIEGLEIMQAVATDKIATARQNDDPNLQVDFSQLAESQAACVEDGASSCSGADDDDLHIDMSMGPPPSFQHTFDDITYRCRDIDLEDAGDNVAKNFETLSQRNTNLTRPTSSPPARGYVTPVGVPDPSNFSNAEQIPSELTPRMQLKNCPAPESSNPRRGLISVLNEYYPTSVKAEHLRPSNKLQEDIHRGFAINQSTSKRFAAPDGATTKVFGSQYSATSHMDIPDNDFESIDARVWDTGSDEDISIKLSNFFDSKPKTRSPTVESIPTSPVLASKEIYTGHGVLEGTTLLKYSSNVFGDKEQYTGMNNSENHSQPTFKEFMLQNSGSNSKNISAKNLEAVINECTLESKHVKPNKETALTTKDSTSYFKDLTSPNNGKHCPTRYFVNWGNQSDINESMNESPYCHMGDINRVDNFLSAFWTDHGTTSEDTDVATMQQKRADRPAHNEVLIQHPTVPYRNIRGLSTLIQAFESATTFQTRSTTYHAALNGLDDDLGMFTAYIESLEDLKKNMAKESSADAGLYDDNISTLELEIIIVTAALKYFLVQKESMKIKFEKYLAVEKENLKGESASFGPFNLKSTEQKAIQNINETVKYTTACETSATELAFASRAQSRHSSLNSDDGDWELL